MRYLFGFLCVCALGVMPLVGCGETEESCVGDEQCDDGNACTRDYCYEEPGGCAHFPIDCRTTFPPLPEWILPLPEWMPDVYHPDCVSTELDVCDPEAPEDQVCGAITIIDDVSCSGDSICLFGRWTCTSIGTCICFLDITWPPVF
jgi:hypothetical protein